MVTSPLSTAANPSAIEGKAAREEKRKRWFELFLVLLVSIGISLLYSIYLLVDTPIAAVRLSTLRSLYGIIHEATSLLLLTYVLSRRNMRLKDLGLRWSRKEILPGVAITILAHLSYIAGRLSLESLHYALFRTIVSGPNPKQFFASPSVMAAPLMLLNPFFEELIVRAYVMTEIMELTGSALVAVLCSVVLQVSYHLYYGWMGALSLAFMFVVFAIYYARSRRALPIIVAHGIFDLLAIIRLL